MITIIKMNNDKNLKLLIAYTLERLINKFKLIKKLSKNIVFKNDDN